MPEQTITELSTKLEFHADDFLADVKLLTTWATMPIEDVLQLLIHLANSLESMQELTANTEEIVRRILAGRAFD